VAQSGTLCPHAGLSSPSLNGFKQKKKAVTACYCNGFEKWCEGETQSQGLID